MISIVFLAVFLIGFLYVFIFVGRRGRNFPPGMTVDQVFDAGRDLPG